MAADLDVAWLAGLLEGEGTFFPGPPSRPRSPVLAIQMIDRDVIARVAQLMGVSAMPVRPRRSHWSTTYAVRIRGARAMAWMGRLHPLLGQRRQAQIVRAMACYAPKPTSILNDRTAREALRMLRAGNAVKTVAAHFDVTAWCIYDLRTGRTHKHLPRSPPTSIKLD